MYLGCNEGFPSVNNNTGDGSEGGTEDVPVLLKSPKVFTNTEE